MVYFKSINVIIYSKASPTYGIQIQKSYPVGHKTDFQPMQRAWIWDQGHKWLVSSVIQSVPKKELQKSTILKPKNLYHGYTIS